MLLKVGAAVMLGSLLLTVVVTVAIALRGEAPEFNTATAGQKQAIEEAAKESESDRTTRENKADLGQKLEIDDAPGQDDAVVRADPSAGATIKGGEEDEPTMRSAAVPRLESRTKPQPEPVPNWPEPTADQVVSANGPRYYRLTPRTDMTLTIEALGLYDVPVLSSSDLKVLDRGLMHEPETSLPWDSGTQRNVFIAGHYLGWPGTASHLVFYNLDKLGRGDEVILEDSQARIYRYRVSEAFEATPEDSWVMGQERDRDMLTLQTCVPPTFEDRLVVRADRA